MGKGAQAPGVAMSRLALQSPRPLRDVPVTKVPRVDRSQLGEGTGILRPRRDSPTHEQKIESNVNTRENSYKKHLRTPSATQLSVIPADDHTWPVLGASARFLSSSSERVTSGKGAGGEASRSLATEIAVDVGVARRHTATKSPSMSSAPSTCRGRRRAQGQQRQQERRR